MRKIAILSFLLLLLASAKGQHTGMVGVMVLIEDSLTHHYVGSSEASSFVQKYPATKDYQWFALDTALLMLEQQFAAWEFCMLEADHFLVYEKNRENLRATDFRNFRENWFSNLQEHFEVDVILVIRNSPTFTDGIHWSNTDITGYGIYNGSRRGYNNVYIQLEFLFFSSGRPLTHIHGPIFQRERDFPRNDKKDEFFEEEDLLSIEEPLRQLITSQIEGAINNANLLRRLR